MHTQMSPLSITFIPAIYVYKVCHLGFVVSISLMKVLDWAETSGIILKLPASVVSYISACKNLATEKFFT